MKRRIALLVPGIATVAALGLQGTAHNAASAATPATRAHEPAVMYNIANTAAINGNTTVIKPAIQPPPVLACLPVSPPSPIPGCVPPAPPAGEPWPGNMAYFGGHVQVNPSIYLVFYGWGDKGAFSTSCATRPAGDPVPCDPDGAGLRMLNFAKQLGGTAWAGVQTQYYETRKDSAGQAYNTYIQNPVNQLKGVCTTTARPSTRR